MTSLFRHAVAAGLLLSGLLSSFSATAENPKVTVLMLGDSGFHKPSEFYRHVAESLGEHSIELRYTEIMAGLKPVQSMDENYRHGRLNPNETVLETRSSESGPVSDPNGEPYARVRNSGNGRVFFTAWGNDHRTWSIVNFQNWLARGVLWACGQTLTAAVDGGENAVDSKAKAVVAANRPFANPKMAAPSIDDKQFKFTKSAF